MDEASAGVFVNLENNQAFCVVHHIYGDKSWIIMDFISIFECHHDLFVLVRGLDGCHY